MIFKISWQIKELKCINDEIGLKLIHLHCQRKLVLIISQNCMLLDFTSIQWYNFQGMNLNFYNFFNFVRFLTRHFIGVRNAVFSVDLIRTPAVVEFREMSAKIFHDSLKNQTKNFNNIISNTFFINSLFFSFGWNGA